MLNYVVIMGRLTAAPELRTTASGQSVTSFILAVDSDYIKQDGTRDTSFIHFVAWRQEAEFICKYFDKGRLMAVKGTLQTRKHKDKNGMERETVDVTVERAYFCGDKKTETPKEPEELPDTSDLPF